MCDISCDSLLHHTDLVYGDSQILRDKCIHVFYCNSRSIKKEGRLDDLLVKIRLLRYPEVIAVTETWLKSCEAVFFIIEEYDLYYVHREEGRAG